MPCLISVSENRNLQDARKGLFIIMNALEEIAKTQPKENSGPGTSLRFEYQMNWGLKKLLELEESGEDYTIAFDYHDDIIVFDKEVNATAVDFYQVKTKKNGNWKLSDLFNPIAKKDETEIPKDDESGSDKDDDSPKEGGKKRKIKSLSFLAKLLSHSLLISASRNFYFVTNRQFNPYGFKKSPSGKQLSFEDVKPEFQEKIKSSIHEEDEKLDVEQTSHFYILQDQIPLDGFKQFLHGAVSDFLKIKATNAEIDAEVFYETLLNRIIRTRNNYDDDITDPKQFVEKKCFTKSQFSELITRLSNLESFNNRCQKITTWLTSPQILPYEADEIQQQLKEIRNDMSLYGNMGLTRIVNQIKDVIEFNKMDRSDTTYLTYAKRMVEMLKTESAEARNFPDNYLIALTLYEKAK